MDSEPQRAVLNLVAEASNSTCADCGEAEPVWASLGFGIFVCLNCAGHHRSLGVHITKVRAVRLDTWSEDQVKPLRAGGNAPFLAYLEEIENLHLGRRKYESPRLLYYPDILDAKMNGREPLAYDADKYGAIAEQITKASTASATSAKQGQASWIPDDSTSGCMLCTKAFTLLNRRHHCRRCGKVCCKACAPADNSRPILEWGLREPVRHCKSCFKSPTVQWKD